MIHKYLPVLGTLATDTRSSGTSTTIKGSRPVRRGWREKSRVRVRVVVVVVISEPDWTSLSQIAPFRWLLPVVIPLRPGSNQLCPLA